MEWVTIWGFVFGGTSLLNVAGYISFYKSKKKVENLTADGKEVEVAKDAMQLVKDVQSQLKENIQSQDILRAHPVASTVTAIPIGVLAYLGYKEKK